MLSILIPIYNFEVIDLVKSLHQQVCAAGIDFEILCFDDGSDDVFKHKNRLVAEWSGVEYQELRENLGRSKIRNALGKAARFEYLLFMDCDSKVVRSNYIQAYLDRVEPETLVYGGRSYSSNPVGEKECYFHWYYGSQREVMDYKMRQQRPYHAFMTNNFLVPRSVFLEIQFDESLRQYGHEDTLFGFGLKARKVPMLHIDNPLEHIGLERTEVFLDKTKKGVENLRKLEKEYPELDTKLVRAYRFCKRFGLGYFVGMFYNMMKAKFERNFNSTNPNLRWFDLYKLGLMLGGNEEDEQGGEKIGELGASG